MPRLDGSFIAVYSDTPPGSPVLGALTRFPEIGRTIFGAPPPVRFLLFDRRPPFERFYGVFDESRGTRPQTPHSTGVVGMVIFCEEKARRETTAETLSLALHETMHAWVATYLRQSYDRPFSLPPYVDEGLATYVAGLWSPEVAALPAQRLSAWRRRGLTAPTLAELRRADTFYEKARAPSPYWLSEQLIERLIGPPEKGVTKIRAFLDAYAKSRDDEAAWREVSGADAEVVYAALASGK